MNGSCIREIRQNVVVAAGDGQTSNVRSFKKFDLSKHDMESSGLRVPDFRWRTVSFLRPVFEMVREFRHKLLSTQQNVERRNELHEHAATGQGKRNSSSSEPEWEFGYPYIYIYIYVQIADKLNTRIMVHPRIYRKSRYPTIRIYGYPDIRNPYPHICLSNNPEIRKSQYLEIWRSDIRRS